MRDIVRREFVDRRDEHRVRAPGRLEQAAQRPCLAVAGDGDERQVIAGSVARGGFVAGQAIEPSVVDSAGIGVHAIDATVDL